ncbi:MAG: glycosyltransferase [Pseudoxanthomonas spadix]|nr:MAG: glycosyltransferase [Pseudoxanthomonas spadix]
MVGPMPPQKTGVADYTASLVAMLRSQGLRVDTITHDDVRDCGAGNVLARLRAADTVVYQIGNHPIYHGWIFPLLAEVPGLVHLHDLVLHHMVAGVLESEGRLLDGGYEQALHKWYSASDVRMASKRLRDGTPLWNSEDVIHYPLHQPVTAASVGVIVHSEYSARKIASDLPWLSVSVVPQLYPEAVPRGQHRRVNTIAILGGGQPNRRFDWVVRALSQVDASLRYPLTLEIAGELVPEVDLQLNQLEEARNIRLIKHGRIDDAGFHQVFERADLMIALRMPTMGETSAVVMKALQAGLPTVVSDHGWYAELPECVRKLEPSAGCPDELAKLLRSLVDDPAFYMHWAEECLHEAGRPDFDPLVAAEQYARLLRNSCVLSDFRDRMAEAVASLKVDVDSPLSAALQKADLLCSMRGDRWLANALAAFSEQTLDAKAVVTGPTVAAYPYAAPLPDGGWLGSARILDEDLAPVEASTLMSVRVEVTNHSNLSWFSPMGAAARPFGIYLGHFWRPLDPSESAKEQPRYHIEEEIAPFVSAVYQVEIRAPDVPGDYILEFDLVQESVSWFQDRGFSPAQLRMRVGPY